jgi:hypothetical protein
MLVTIDFIHADWHVQWQNLSLVFHSRQKWLTSHRTLRESYVQVAMCVTKILTEQKSLLSKIHFDAEADNCFISCDDEQSMKDLAEFIHHSLSTKKKLNDVILKIDKAKLDC